MRLKLLSMLLAAVPALASATEVTGTVKVPAGKPPELSVVHIVVIPGKSFSAPEKAAIMDQKLKTYTPHVLVVQQGQHVIFPNTDLVRHNVYSPSKLHPFNLGIYPPGSKKEETFDKAGVVSLLCNVHPEMSGFIVVVETPYYGMTDKDGKFAIKDVPPGDYEFVAWHEGLPEVRRTFNVSGARQEIDFAIKKER